MKHLLCLMLFIPLLLLSSCVHTRYVPVVQTERRTDSCAVVNMKHDSIYLHDSIATEVMQRGDTVYYTRTQTRYGYRTQYVHDTVRCVRTDTVVRPVVVASDVANRVRPMWHKWVKVVCLIVCLIGIVVFVVPKGK